jgi:MFS superfamily sulfate permease-like transporter
MQSMWVFRWILLALSAVLAAFLIVRGNVVIGVIVGVMALTRAVFFVKMQHRREQFREKMAARRGQFPGRFDQAARGQEPALGRKRSKRNPWSSRHSALPPDS